MDLVIFISGSSCSWHYYNRMWELDLWWR